MNKCEIESRFGEVLKIQITKSLLKLSGGSFLDKHNILYKLENDKLIGKRVVESKDRRYLWLSDIDKDEVLVWMHGENADYDEIFEK